MPEYSLTWITPNLAVGYAPMSYAELESIREQGIDAIVNLCGEFCDLHEIEEKSGFDVYFLPIPDEGAPDMEKMEKALEWLDEAIYLGKKVLVHCRHGIGRTGTFVTAYLIRRGLGLKLASKKLKATRASPTNYNQWRLLKKYGKRERRLTIREPSLEEKNIVDLQPFFNEYESLVKKIEADIKAANKGSQEPRCGHDSDECCNRYFELTLIESVYLSNTINRMLKSATRKEIINRATDMIKVIRKIKKELGQTSMDSYAGLKKFNEIFKEKGMFCPLLESGKCILYDFRPIRCRCYRVTGLSMSREEIDALLFNISRNMFFALSGTFLDKKALHFSIADTVSGRFVQEYFHYLSRKERPVSEIR